MGLTTRLREASPAAATASRGESPKDVAAMLRNLMPEYKAALPPAQKLLLNTNVVADATVTHLHKLSQCQQTAIGTSHMHELTVCQHVYNLRQIANTCVLLDNV